MTHMYGVHVACNDPDNGNFAGKAQMLQLDFGKGDYLELGMCGAREPNFRVERSRFRLGRLWYSFERSSDWVGNWCWNAYYVTGLTAAKLAFDLMRDKRWACEGGLVEACDAYDAKDNGAFMRSWHRSLWPPKPVQLVGSVSPEDRSEEDV